MCVFCRIKTILPLKVKFHEYVIDLIRYMSVHMQISDDPYRYALNFHAKCIMMPKGILYKHAAIYRKRDIYQHWLVYTVRSI